MIDWLKNKWVRFKKSIIAIFIGTALAATGGTAVLDTQINPYTATPSKYEVSFVQTVPDSGMAKADLWKDSAKVTLSKWDGEIALGISYPKIKAQGNRKILTNRVEWKGVKEEMHAYPLDATTSMEGGGIEIEIVLNEKSATNRFEFTIDGAENLDFFYQPALTAQEIKDGAERPENVIGSYAVYHKTKRDYRIGDTNYATGKAFHIYRPKVIDANGVETWGILDYKNGILSATVPQSFLDNAVYPVKVDPTFGYTTAGASNEFSTADPSGSYFTSVDGDVVSMTGYQSGQFGDENCRWAIYLTSDQSRLALSNEYLIQGTSAAWQTEDISLSGLSSSTEYWLILDCDRGASTGSNRLYYDALGLTNSLEDLTSGYPPPVTILLENTAEDRTFSIYATYSLPLSVDTTAATNIATTSMDFGGDLIALGSATSVDLYHDYGTSTAYGLTTTATSTTTTTTYTTSASGLTALTVYHFRAFASSTSDNTTAMGTDFVAVTGDFSGVDQTNADWTAGTHSTTTADGDGNLQLTVTPGGDSLVDTESFENTFGDWTNDTGSGSNCWQFDTNNTGSSNTGPSAPQDATYYVYTETSGSTQCRNAYWDSITYTLSRTTSGYVDFYYHMYGASMGTLTLEAYDGAAWTAFLTKAGQQEQTDELDPWTHVTDATFPDDTEKIRFYYTGSTSYTGDAGLDLVKVYESTTATSTGDRTSVAFDVTGITDVDSSDITWSGTTPASTTIVVGTEVNTSSSTPPGSFNTVSSGGTIGGISADDDLSTKWLWVNIAFQSDSDSGGAIPFMDWLTIGITQDAAAPAVRRFFRIE